MLMVEVLAVIWDHDFNCNNNDNNAYAKIDNDIKRPSKTDFAISYKLTNSLMFCNKFCNKQTGKPFNMKENLNKYM